MVPVEAHTGAVHLDVEGGRASRTQARQHDASLIRRLLPERLLGTPQVHVRERPLEVQLQPPEARQSDPNVGAADLFGEQKLVVAQEVGNDEDVHEPVPQLRVGCAVPSLHVQHRRAQLDVRVRKDAPLPADEQRARGLTVLTQIRGEEREPRGPEEGEGPRKVKRPVGGELQLIE